MPPDDANGTSMPMNAIVYKRHAVSTRGCRGKPGICPSACLLWYIGREKEIERSREEVRLSSMRFVMRDADPRCVEFWNVEI